MIQRLANLLAARFGAAYPLETYATVIAVIGLIAALCLLPT